MAAIEKVKVLVLGDSGVGKTSLTYLIAQNKPLLSPGWTVGCSVEVKLHRYKEGTQAQNTFFVELWDVGGSTNHRTTRNVFYQPTHGIILVHDLTNRKSQLNLQKWLSEALNQDNGNNKPLHMDVDPEQFLGSTQIPILVIGTKFDLAEEKQRKNQYRRMASSIAEQCGADEIFVNCHQARSLAPGTTSAVKLTRFFDKIKEKLRVHFNSFMLNVHSRIHELKISSGRGASLFRDEKAKPFDPIPPVAEDITQESWLICFDEFQVTDIGDAMVLKRLFTQLFDNGCVVIATSNRKPDDLYKNGLQRSNFLPFIPVLKQHCTVLQLDSGIDYRMRNADGGGLSTYFLNSNLTPQNNGVDNLFKFLISKENDTVRPRIINIFGRNVKFARACGQVLDTTFDELCDRPLGSSDYLVISKTFHTVIIREVPQLSIVRHRSQLRRFITLIDTLYDNRVRVVIAADALPKDLFKVEQSHELDDASRTLMDDLKISKGSENAGAAIFTGEEEMFACDRCLSRITEMQTSSYWEKWGSHIS